MEPDETKSVRLPQFSNPNRTYSKTPPTIQITSSSPQPQISSHRGRSKPKPRLRKVWRLAMKRTGAIVIILFVLALIFAGLFNLAKGAIWYSQSFANDNRTAQPSVTPKPFEQIQTSSTAPATASSDKNNCTDLPIRMTNAKIDSQQVNKIFYQTYPERVNRPLTDTVIDRALRQEWCAVANKIIEQKFTK
jgi:hypothetical protein